jgi:hypothetical protein
MRFWCDLPARISRLEACRRQESGRLDMSRLRRSLARDLIDIASETWKSDRSSDAKTRTAATAALKERRRSKPFEEI